METKDILRTQLETGRYADLKIICGPSTFNVHKCVVCLYSKWFEAACRSEWKEGNEGVVRLEPIGEQAPNQDFTCDDPEAVKLMIDFMYLADYKIGHDWNDSSTVDATSSRKKKTEWHSDYDYDHGYHHQRPEGAAFQEPKLTEEEDSCLAMHAKVFALGVKYEIPALKQAAVKKLKQAIINHWNKKDFALALTIAFESTPDEEQDIREVMIEAILERSKALSTDIDVGNAIQSVDGLSFELFKRQAVHSCEIVGEDL